MSVEVVMNYPASVLIDPRRTCAYCGRDTAKYGSDDELRSRNVLGTGFEMKWAPRGPGGAFGSLVRQPRQSVRQYPVPRCQRCGAYHRLVREIKPVPSRSSCFDGPFSWFWAAVVGVPVVVMFGSLALVGLGSAIGSDAIKYVAEWFLRLSVTDHVLLFGVFAAVVFVMAFLAWMVNLSKYKARVQRITSKNSELTKRADELFAPNERRPEPEGLGKSWQDGMVLG